MYAHSGMSLRRWIDNSCDFSRATVADAPNSASGAELQTQLLVGTRIEILSEEEASTLIADAEEVGRMIHGLVAALERPADHEPLIPWP